MFNHSKPGYFDGARPVRMEDPAVVVVLLIPHLTYAHASVHPYVYLLKPILMPYMMLLWPYPPDVDPPLIAQLPYFWYWTMRARCLMAMCAKD